ncbi:MAG TPA: AsmA family protein [Alphaproteobacteria bacterium]
MISTRRLWILPLGIALVLAAAALLWQLRGPAWLMPLVTGQIETMAHLRLETGGPVEAHLLPAPGLRARDVRFSPAEPGAPPLGHAAALEVSFSWPRLLRGELQIDTLRLPEVRLLTDTLHPPLEIVARFGGPAVEITLAADGASGRITAHPEAGTLALDDVVLQAGRMVAAGSGRLLAHDPVRLVLNTQLSLGDMRLGTVSIAASYSADGVVLERADWRQLDGGELALFGHAAVEGDGVRFEGGMGASLGPPNSSADTSARFDGTFGAAGLALAIDDIDLRTGASHLSGRARYAAGPPGQLSTELRVDRLDLAALPTLGPTVERSPLGALAPALAVVTSDLDLRLRLGQLDLKDRPLAEGLVIDLLRHGGAIELRELAARSLLGAPLRASGRIAFAPAAMIAIDPLMLTYGSLSAAGRTQLDLSGPRPRLVLDVASNALALDALLAGPPPLPPEPMTRRAAAAASVAAARQTAPAAGWSRVPFALPQSLPLDAEISFAAPRLTWHGYRLDDAQAVLEIAERQIALKRLNGQLYGGMLEASGLSELQVRPRLSGRLQLMHANLAAALGGIADIRNVDGLGDIIADLKAEGDTVADLVASSAGTVSVAAQGGTISGIDLPAVAEHLKRFTRATDLVELGRLATGGRTPFQTLKGRLQLDRGIARTDGLVLTAANGSAETRGSIDLPGWALNLTNEFQLSEPPGMPPLVIKLDGPIASPRRVFDISRLQAYLLRRGAPAPAR